MFATSPRRLVCASIVLSSAAAAEPPDRPARSAASFEVHAGIGAMHAHKDIARRTDVGLAVGLGLGGWVSSRLLLSGRVAVVTYAQGAQRTATDHYAAYRMTGGFMGPAVQYWIGDGWIGGGLGLGVVTGSEPYDRYEASEGSVGLGLSADLRAGYSLLSGGPYAWGVSVEISPARIDGATVATFGVLVGFQHR